MSFHALDHKYVLILLFTCVHVTCPSPSQDVNEENCYRHPKLYIAGQTNKNFTAFTFVRSVAKGIWVAFVVFFILMGMTLFNEFPAGWEWDFQSFGLAASAALVVIVNLQVSLVLTTQVCTYTGTVHLSCRSGIVINGIS